MRTDVSLGELLEERRRIFALQGQADEQMAVDLWQRKMRLAEAGIERRRREAEEAAGRLAEVDRLYREDLSEQWRRWRIAGRAFSTLIVDDPAPSVAPPASPKPRILEPTKRRKISFDEE